MGLWLDRPTLGCAKSVLVGGFKAPAAAKGSFTALVLDEEVLGAALRVESGRNPVFISVGHKITLKEAVGLTVRCSDGFRIPKPTREADRWSKQIKALALGPSSPKGIGPPFP